MKKLKSKKTATKRFKVTKSGKILRGHALSSHLKRKKTANRLRKNEKMVLVSEADRKRLERTLRG
ncbi:MAG: 50S ribosomal protein L35 [Candidatus Woykebacteria bacterium RBG_13_40_7b]|uniref:Large ribosomal subunit protein bL35 n=1 Tax=Candidatus Woykebacteria bacterium RBG_13_40_7b TaxID=1802594 RepID=A0A1G1W9P8_9BACT|nr:MAG: 50S ribosomal protein L35 [Candidatus Woykebacteria bacterium RBG_13_40_7b]